MRPSIGIGLLGALGLVLVPRGASAQAASPSGPTFREDPVLRELVGQAIAMRPEVARARAQVAAETERAPQARALPDPSLSMGIQNDGFRGIEIGKMPSSWLYIVASQTLPWFGKRDLRAQLAGLDGEVANADLVRALMQTAADMERAYLDLLFVRARLGLLAQLETLWKQTELAARARYEVGDVPQSDLLRPQLERTRLRQQRFSLEAEARRRLAILNRLRGQTASAEVPTPRGLVELPDPDLIDVEQAISAAEAASPEIRKAQLAAKLADQRVDLAKKDRFPDLTVSAGIMPRWGDFPTMWQAGIALNLPVWSLGKQARVVAEYSARGQAARSGTETVRQVIALRVRERAALLASLVEANRLYRQAVLPQSERLVSSALLQYQAGRAPFATVLDALSGYLSDQNSFLESMAAAERVAIAEREMSLDSPGSFDVSSLAGTSVASTGSAGSTSGENAASGTSRM